MTHSVYLLLSPFSARSTQRPAGAQTTRPRTTPRSAVASTTRLRTLGAERSPTPEARKAVPTSPVRLERATG
ncbi:MAG: hypothetical protein AAFV53_29265 [Myxococcota bacterium]